MRTGMKGWMGVLLVSGLVGCGVAPSDDESPPGASENAESALAFDSRIKVKYLGTWLAGGTPNRLQYIVGLKLINTTSSPRQVRGFDIHTVTYRKDSAGVLRAYDYTYGPEYNPPLGLNAGAVMNYAAAVYTRVGGVDQVWEDESASFDVTNFSGETCAGCSWPVQLPPPSCFFSVYDADYGTGGEGPPTGKPCTCIGSGGTRKRGMWIAVAGWRGGHGIECK